MAGPVAGGDLIGRFTVHRHRRLFGGQGEENVVETRSAHLGGRAGHAAGVEPSKDLGQQRRTVGPPHHHTVLVVADHPPHAHGPQGRDRARQPRRVALRSATPAGADRWTWTVSPPRRALSSAGVPVATMRPWSITATVSASRSASSRYCVVNSIVVPSAARPSTSAQTSRRLAGSSPEVGSSRNSTAGSDSRGTAAAGRGGGAAGEGRSPGRETAPRAPTAG